MSGVPRAEGGAELRGKRDAEGDGGETAPATARGESKGDSGGGGGERRGNKIAGGASSFATVAARVPATTARARRRRCSRRTVACGSAFSGSRTSRGGREPRGAARGGPEGRDGRGKLVPETSLSDDVSGSGNDENPEVTMDSQGEPAVGTMSGDGGSVVGEDEDEAATDDPENRGEHQIASKNRAGRYIPGGSGEGAPRPTRARPADRSLATDTRANDAPASPRAARAPSPARVSRTRDRAEPPRRRGASAATPASPFRSSRAR